ALEARANRMPMAIWRDGITGAPGGKAVDMTPAWTTPARCPHARGRNSGGKQLNRLGRKERPDFQPNLKVSGSNPVPATNRAVAKQNPASRPGFKFAGKELPSPRYQYLVTTGAGPNKLK
ncbi:MAG: hypothetical protein WAM10_03700, partial [Methylocella sp.]